MFLIMSFQHTCKGAYFVVSATELLTLQKKGDTKFTLLLYKLPWAHVSTIQVLSPNALLFFRS